MNVPFLIHEASLTVYQALPGGVPGEVWWTATALEGADLSARREHRVIWPTGARYPHRRRGGPGLHELTFHNIWRLPAQAPFTPDPLAADDLVLDVLWTDQRNPSLWHQRRYRDAVWVEDGLAGSVGQAFASRIRFEAGRCLQSGSAGTDPYGLTPAVQQVLFTREAPATLDATLAGVAAWSVPVEILHAQVTWRPVVGIGAATTIRCQLAGSAYIYTDIVLPDAASAEAMSTATYSFDGELPTLSAGEAVTWSVVDAPADSGDCATHLSVVMTVQPVV